jgi:hypothetical protein
MQLTRLASLALAAVVLAPGCTFYFGGDDDCTYVADEAPAIGRLDPSTLQCDYSGGGGGGSCSNGSGGPLADDYRGDWGFCSNACTGLAEGECLLGDGCRAVYTEREVFDPTEWVRVYGGCYPTAPSGPVRGGGCDGLDAQTCSTHDDCAAVHENVPGAFQRCIPEPSICVPTPTVPVQLLRDPSTGRCEPSGGGGGGGCTGGGATPPPPPPVQHDWGVCGSPCEALDETSCRAADGCRAIFANRFPPNADGIDFVYEACWPTAPSGPVRGGGCAGLDAQECSRHDDCIAEHESDWSGCPDFSNCDFVAGNFDACVDETAPPPACNTLGEDACVARADCTPLYAGSNCDCTPAGCTCQTWTFDTCTDH